MMHGPGRRGAPMPAMSLKGQGKLLSRVLKFIMKNYGAHFVVVLLCIFAHRGNIQRLIKGQERKTHLFSKGKMQ